MDSFKEQAHFIGQTESFMKAFSWALKFQAKASSCGQMEVSMRGRFRMEKEKDKELITVFRKNIFTQDSGSKG
jgi:hypothetical protein